jgi:hypothetical protein
MRAVDSPRGTLCATLSSASGKEGNLSIFKVLNPLSAEGEERVVERSKDG